MVYSIYFSYLKQILWNVWSGNWTCSSVLLQLWPPWDHCSLICAQPPWPPEHGHTCVHSHKEFTLKSTADAGKTSFFCMWQVWSLLMTVLICKIPIIKDHLDETVSSTNHKLPYSPQTWEVTNFCLNIFALKLFSLSIIFSNLCYFVTCLWHRIYISLLQVVMSFHKTTAAMSNPHRAEHLLFFIIKGSCYSVQIETSIYCRKVPGCWKQLLLKLVHQMLIFFFFFFFPLVQSVNLYHFKTNRRHFVQRNKVEGVQTPRVWFWMPKQTKRMWEKVIFLDTFLYMQRSQKYQL